MSSPHVDSDNFEAEETELLTIISQSIATGSSPSFVEAILNSGPAGYAIRLQLNRTVPGFNCTLLMILVNMPDEDQAIAMAELLVQYGADVNQADDTDIRSSPLCFAADSGKAKYLTWLVDHGARINHHASVSPTMPIGLSSEKNFPECVAVLAKAAIARPVCRERLATLDAPSINGKTPAYVAMEKGHAECLGALAMAGADLRRCFPVLFDSETHLFDIRYDGLQPHSSMQKAVASFTTLHCANCRKFERVQSCSRCRIAQYCSRECQTKDWKLHKKCCKRLRAGEDLVSDTDTTLPAPRSEPFGFQSPNPIGANVVEDEDDDDVADGNEPVWQFNAGSRGVPDWKCYPTKINRYLECMFQMGGPKYMYRPGDDDAEGAHLPAPFPLSPVPPPGVSTNYVYYHDMLEREVFTGAIRAVRRNGERTAPEVENPVF